MKKYFIKYVVFLAFLLMLTINVTLIFLFATTGSYIPVVLFPFGVACLMLTLEEL